MQINFKHYPSSRGYVSAVKDVLAQTCKIVSCPKNAEVAVVFIGDKKMRELNQLYRNKDKVSNVLSFSCGELGIMNYESGVDLGNIFICVPEARREVKKYGITLQFEISRLAVHGFLHLLEYDHKDEKEAKEMEEVEDKILRSIVD